MITRLYRFVLQNDLLLLLLVFFFFLSFFFFLIFCKNKCLRLFTVQFFVLAAIFSMTVCLGQIPAKYWNRPKSGFFFILWLLFHLKSLYILHIYTPSCIFIIIIEFWRPQMIHNNGQIECINQKDALFS